MLDEPIRKKRISVAQRKAERMDKNRQALSGAAAKVDVQLDERDALRGYEAFHRLPVGSATLLDRFQLIGPSGRGPFDCWHSEI